MSIHTKRLLKQHFSFLFKKSYYDAINFLFPLKCQNCGLYLPSYPPKHLCKSCEKQLYNEIKPVCVICGKIAKRNHNLPYRCKTCLNKPAPRIVFLSGGLYAGILKELIHKFKYDKKEFLDKTLGEFLAQFINFQNMDLSNFNYIIPVPLSAVKMRERGFNQSELVALELSKRYRIALNTKSIFRRYHKHSQAGLNRTERLTNLSGVFRLSKKHSLLGKSVILIDDVKSTGSTLYFCSEVLFSGGVKYILALSLADNN